MLLMAHRLFRRARESVLKVCRFRGMSYMQIPPPEVLWNHRMEAIPQLIAAPRNKPAWAKPWLHLPWKAHVFAVGFSGMNLSSTSWGGSPVSELRCCLSVSEWGSLYHIWCLVAWEVGVSGFCHGKNRTQKMEIPNIEKVFQGVGQPKTSTPWGLIKMSFSS